MNANQLASHLAKTKTGTTRFSEMTREQLCQVINERANTEEMNSQHVFKACFGSKEPLNKADLDKLASELKELPAPIEMSVEDAKKFVEMRLAESPYTFPLMPQNVLGDKGFMKYALEEIRPFSNPSVLAYAPQELRNDKELAELAIRNGDVWGYSALGKELRNNKNFLASMHNLKEKNKDGKERKVAPIPSIDYIGTEALKDNRFAEWCVDEDLVPLYEVDKLVDANPEVLKDDNVMYKLLMNNTRILARCYDDDGISGIDIRGKAYGGTKEEQLKRLLGQMGHGDNKLYLDLIKACQQIGEINDANRGIGSIEIIKNVRSAIAKYRAQSIKNKISKQTIGKNNQSVTSEIGQ